LSKQGKYGSTGPRVLAFPKGDSKMNTVTPTELADSLQSDPRTVRKFLRFVKEKDTHPGRGHRWELPGGKRDMNRLKKQFGEWRAEHTREGAKEVSSK
jgi:hypothetical protein